MDPLLYELSSTLDTLDSRDAILRAMDEIDTVYNALNEIQREAADDIMSRLLKRLDVISAELPTKPSG
jgi:hypothetical protein